MNQIQTIEEYREALNNYFTFVSEMLKDSIARVLPLEASAALAYGFWDKKAEKLIRDFDSLERDNKNEWLKLSYESRELNRADKRKVILEEKARYEGEINLDLTKITNYAGLLLSEEAKYSPQDQLVRDINKASLVDIKSYTLNKLLAFWIVNS
jgi:hypothetical protein